MSEKENNSQTQKPKTCSLAKWSFGLSITIAACIVIDFIITYPVPIVLLCSAPIAGLLAPILGIISIFKIKKSRGKLKGVGLAIPGIIIGIAICSLILVGMVYGSMSVKESFDRMVCHGNMRELSSVMWAYARDSNEYPQADKWCDLLIEGRYVTERAFKCPRSKKGRCSYAINPNAEPNSPNDVVLLFETQGGWNLFGGPELLTTRNHQGRGAMILFNKGRVAFVRPEQFDDLKWKSEEKQEGSSGNFRRPGNDKELKYWLENMVWYHRFTNEEMRAATGLTVREIIASLKKFDIRPENRPKRAENAPLLVIPYPGGRHPRIGFLDGAINPQRETKFSVFTPWDANSYVVVDVPEAIWSNLGLTYLAHTHIDTIWTKQGIELPKLEWKRHPDGTLDIERRLPNGIAFGVQVKPTKETVQMELWLKNGTDQKLSDLRVQNCVMTKMAAGFEQQTNDNKVLTNPYVACRNSNGKKWIITAWENCNHPWANDKCPCFHSDPKFPDLEPGQTYRLHGWLSFYEGTNIKAEFERIESTGWRKK